MKLHTLHYTLHEVAGYINWLYFFHAWGFPARLASIAQVHGCEACRLNWLTAFPPDERERARQAMQLYDDATALLLQMDSYHQTHARVAIIPANGDAEDIVLHLPQGQQRLPMLRQQHPDADGYCLCLSDFLRPLHSGITDTVGLFAATVDDAIETGESTDDYRHMLHQTLADRLAEATAERAHEEVRQRIWGYAPAEQLTLQQLFAEQYQGRRPAVGYPSLPDQSINFLLSPLLDFPGLGIQLTESGAMRPHASTSGLMMAHPQARHFSVGTISDEQLHDYARRRQLPPEVARRFLASNLG